MATELKKYELAYIGVNNADILAVSATHVLLKIQSLDGTYKIFELRQRRNKHLMYVSNHIDENSAKNAWDQAHK